MTGMHLAGSGGGPSLRTPKEVLLKQKIAICVFNKINITCVMLLYTDRTRVIFKWSIMCLVNKL